MNGMINMTTDTTTDLTNQSNVTEHITTGIYQHYKGQRYQVLHCGRHSETQELMVVYRCLYGDYSIWIRPLSMFQSQVMLANNELTPRFSLEIATEITT